LTKCFLWIIIYFDKLSRSQATSRGGSHACPEPVEGPPKRGHGSPLC
jgi:hypothetical protein